MQSLLRASVEAFVVRDAGAVTQLEQGDDHIDEFAGTTHTHTQRYLQDSPISATRAVPCLFAAHNLERIADRAINIAERTIFIAGQATRAVVSVASCSKGGTTISTHMIGSVQELSVS